MPVEIENRWIENLIEKRALVREALQGKSLEDFPVYILRKQNLLIKISSSDRGICYECGERIEAEEGLRVSILEKNTFKTTGKPFEIIEWLYFHKYHF